MTILCAKPVGTDLPAWKLGVSDHTLVVLSALLLDDERDESVTPLAEAMTLDPAFTIWAATVMARPNATYPTIRMLAGQVAPMLDRLLQDALSCDEVSEDALLASEAPRSTSLFQNGSLHALIRAQIALSLAPKPPSPCDDPVYLATILASTALIVGCKPDEATFLEVQLTDSEKAAVVMSGRLIEKDHLRQEFPELGDRDERSSDDCLPLGPGWIEQRRQHLEQKIPEAETLLKKLLARLDRVRQMETSFHETLEHEKLEAMAEFAAGAGHEINNPIAVIAGRAQLMLQDETDPERARSLALINAQAKRVYEMIADMRLFARPPEPTFERVELISLIDELFDELAEAVDAHGATLRRIGVRRAVELDADPTQLTILLRVMIQNSLEALGSGGTIEIEVDESPGENGAYQKGDRHLLPLEGDGVPDGRAQKEPVPLFAPDPSFVTIRVSDDGPGITDEVRRHLFDPYYSGRQAGRGLGLGLSKAWRIVVTNHGGTIEVDSQPGQGAAFTVHLPKCH